VAAHGGRGFLHRLAVLGICPGTPVTLIQGDPGGPVVVEARGTRLVLGRGMAQRVMVTPED